MTNPKFQIGDSVIIKNRIGNFTVVGRMKQPSVELSLTTYLEGGSSIGFRKGLGGWFYRLNNGNSQWFSERLVKSLVQCPNSGTVGYERAIGCHACGIGPEDLE